MNRTKVPASARWWDKSAALLLLAALVTAASRLVATGWADQLNRVQSLAFLGMVAGLALGQSRFSSRLVVILGLAYGGFAIPWQLGLTLGPDVEWTERLLSLAGRLNVAMSELARQDPVQDSLLFLALMTSLFWTLGAHAGYVLTRLGRPWRAALPPGIALLVIQIYDPFITGRVWFLAAYLLFCLLLVARLVHLRRRVHWQRSGVLHSSTVGPEIARATALATVILVVLAWTMPAVAAALPPAEQAWERITRPWIAIRDQFDNAFASLRVRVGVVVPKFHAANLRLGRGSELTDTPVLTVEAAPNPPLGVRHYWRARVYDHYADGQWGSSVFTTTESVTPSRFGLEIAEMEQRSTRSFTLTTDIFLSTLYVPTQPLWVSRPAQAVLASNPDDTTDLAALHATPYLYPGEIYRARASLSTVTIAQLRAAGTDYPEWVAERYLQLPPTISPRTEQLARRLGADLDNPFDIAATITGYLRHRIRYSETVPIDRRPSDQEPVDWFLFDLREGFCNYYATAEIIMLRSLGIPSRLGVGHAEGEHQGDGVYVVRRRDAHAWPEVYFPGLGWIEFEPTASQRPLSRPPGERAPGDATDAWSQADLDSERAVTDELLERLLARDEGFLLEPTVPGASDTGAATPLWGVLIALVLILISRFWQARRRGGLLPLPVLLEAGIRRLGMQPPAVLRRRSRLAVMPPLARAYQEFNSALARLGAYPESADTPAERAAALIRLLPDAEEPAGRLLAEYHVSAYSPRPGNLHDAQRASRSIRLLSWRSVLRRLVARLGSARVSRQTP